MPEPVRCPICGLMPDCQTAENYSFLPSRAPRRFKCCIISSDYALNDEEAVENWNNAVAKFELQKEKKENTEVKRAIPTICRILARGNDVEIRSKKDGVQVIEIIKKTIYST